jgi:hypothetical protein
MSSTYFQDAVRDDGETEIVVEIRVNSWGCDAQTYGPPESCYPAEPIECEVIKAWLKADDNLTNPPLLELSDAEKERIEREF